MKIPPIVLKWTAVFLVIATVIGYPLSAFTFGKTEPPVVLGLSWGAILLTAFAFYVGSQDGEDIDTLLDNQKKMMEKMGIKVKKT